MVRNGVKRKISGQENDSNESRVKKPRKKAVQDESSEGVVEEFLRLACTKQTRLKGFKQFLSTLKSVKEKHEIILQYLRSRPDCSEMFQVFSESLEQRSPLEMQIVLELLEMIILQLAEGDMSTKSRATAIVSKLLTNHRKLVYNCLNSASPAGVTMAMLKLLTAVVMHGPALARELLTAFDFSHKTFGTLVNRRDKKDVVDVRTCFIKFVLSFFVTGDAPLIEQVLKIKGFATSILKNLQKDSAEVIHLVLSTLLGKIIQNRSILKKTKILLFTSYSLSQLARLYSYEEDSSVRERVHQFLLQLCASQNSIAFENKLGIFSVGSNNPVLLRFLHSLPKGLNDVLLIELVIKTLLNSKDLISPYLSGYQMALEPRNSQQWINNTLFLIKLYFHLPLPSCILKNPALSPDRVSRSRLLSVVSPENVKRNILTRGLQHPDAVVQGSTLSLLLLILRRSCNMMDSTNIDAKILTSFHEDVFKLLPSFQVLVSIRENLGNRIKEASGDKKVKDLPPQLCIKDATIILARTLACMRLFQALAPNCFTQSNYDPWKLLARISQEEALYNLSSKVSMLQIFQNCPSRHFKWHSQSKTDNSAYFKQVLHLFCHEKKSSIQRMTKELLKKFFVGTGVCGENEDVVSIWLHSMLDDCIPERAVVIDFFEKVYGHLANDPFRFVDDVIEAIQTVTLASQSHLIALKVASKRSLPFSPIVPCVLTLFAGVVKDKAENLDILARYLNLVLLNILEIQNDPRPLCNMIVKILTQDNVTSLPVHTRIILNYVSHWTSGVNLGALGISKDDERRFRKNFKQLEKTEMANHLLALYPKQFKKQIYSSIRSAQSFDTSFAENYLRCNPVFLFDSENLKEVLEIFNELPCFLIVQQLLMFLLKQWQSGIFKDTDVWKTCKAFIDATLVSATRGNIESMKRTVSATLCLANNLANLYLQNPGNQLAFLETQKTVIEVLKIVFDQVREMSNEMMDLSDYSTNVVGNGVIDSDDVTRKHTNDIIINSAFTEDVIGAIDETCGKCQEENLDDGKNLSRFMNIVFNDNLFKILFYSHIGLKVEEDSNGLSYVSKIISDCIAELMMHLYEEILGSKDCECLELYFIRIAEAVKDEAFGGQNIDVKLPYKVTAASLLKTFHKCVPGSTLSNVLDAYLANLKNQNVETKDGERNGLSRNCETVIEVVECLLDKDEIHFNSMSLEVLDGVIHLLMSMNSQRSDEMIAKFITKFPELPDEILLAVLHYSLDQVTSTRVQTVVLAICERPSLLRKLEDWLIARVNKKSQKKKSKEVKLLEVESEWITFLPLLLFYLSTVGKEENASEPSVKCLKYIHDLTWPRLKRWLLEMKYIENSNDCLKMVCLLLEIDDNADCSSVQRLFTDLVVTENFHKLNVFQVEAVHHLLQRILKQSSKEEKQKKYMTIFIFACMERLPGLMKSQNAVDNTLRLKILNYLEEYGQKSLKMKKTDTFSVQDFVKVTNTFVKSSLRFCFSCSLTLNVLSILIKTIYDCCPDKSLLPPNDLYQFILNHSKFLEIFLGNISDSCGKDDDTKGALVDLLQTVVDLEPSCCEPSHLFLILGSYGAKLSLTDQKLLRLLYTYEANLADAALGSRVLWGEAAIEAYKASKNGPTTLWNELNVTQVLDLIDSKLLLQSAKHFPQHKPLQPAFCEDLGSASQFYDPSFLLPIFSFFLAPGCEVNCKRFIDSSALAFTISALTSAEKEIRQVAYQILSRFQNHLTTARFREQQQVVHLLHYFQNGITEANCRISTLMTSFMARALHIFFYPEDPLYPSVNSYMLQKAFIDLRDVPLFLSLLNNSDLMYRTERTWLLHLILDGLRDPMDYYICKKFHVFQQLFTLYNSAIADKFLQNLILKIVHEVCRHHVSAYDLCQNYGLVPWLHLLINNNSNTSENFSQIVDILSTLWFTLNGQTKSHAASNYDTSCNRAPIPRNICSELLLVLLSILQAKKSSDTWNDEVFVSFTNLLASLLRYQDCLETQVNFAKQRLVLISKIWQDLFGKIDFDSKLEVLIKSCLDLSVAGCKTNSEKWFKSMKFLLQIFVTSDSMENERKLKLCEALSRLDGKNFALFLKVKMRGALQTFCSFSGFSLPADQQLKLLFVKQLVFKHS